VNQLSGKPFALLGVHGNDYPPKKLKEVMDKEKLNWRSLSSRAISSKWSARSTPTYYILDHKGVIRYKWSGYPGAKAIDPALEKLINEAE
jgi:thioredoxin-related protein